jgi:hypothetical protein
MVEGATLVGAAAAVGGGSALLGGVVLAGSALGTLGMITGSQKLQRIGGIVGLVGGVGAIANSAGMLGDIAGQASKGVSGAEAFEGASSSAALGQSAAPAPVVDGAPAVSDAAAQAENAGQIGIDNAASGGVLGKGPSPGVIGGNAAPGSPVKALLPGSAPLDPRLLHPPRAVRCWPPTGNGVGGTLGKVGSFIKNNKELANVAGGIVTGGLSDYNKQKMQQRAYEMQQQAILADRARQTASVTGLQMPGYVPPPVPVPPKG